MERAVCTVCGNPVALDEELVIGQIFVCGHCQTIYHVVSAQPLRLRPLGNTGDLTEDGEDQET